MGLGALLGAGLGGAGGFVLGGPTGALTGAQLGGALGGGLFDDQRGGIVKDALGRRQGELDSVIAQLQRQASGEQSVARAQLQEGLARNVAGQQALAASARPGQAAGAQRQAAQNASLLGSQFAQQSALARLAEQQQASRALGGLLANLRGQDLAGAQALIAKPTQNEQILGGLSGLGQALAQQKQREHELALERIKAGAEPER